MFRSLSRDLTARRTCLQAASTNAMAPLVGDNDDDNRDIDCDGDNNDDDNDDDDNNDDNEDDDDDNDDDDNEDDDNDVDDNDVDDNDVDDNDVDRDIGWDSEGLENNDDSRDVCVRPLQLLRSCDSTAKGCTNADDTTGTSHTA